MKQMAKSFYSPAVGVTAAAVPLVVVQLLELRQTGGGEATLFSLAGIVALVPLLAVMMVYLRRRRRESTLEIEARQETRSEVDRLVGDLRSSALASEGAGRKLASQVGETLAATTRIASRSTATEEAVRELSDQVQEGASAMEEIMASIESLVKRISQQNGVVEESASAVEQMSASIESVAQVAQSKRGASDELVELTVTGSERVQRTETVIEEVGQEVGSVKDMIKVINEVAARTNMLAMNAAIEAAHAGQYGRGFAVVADEIRSLAESTSKNATNISKTLGNLVERMNDARVASQETREAFSRIEGGAHSVSDAFGEITTSTQELAIGTQEVVNATESLSGLTREINESASEMRVGAEDVTKVLTGAREAAGGTTEAMEMIRDAASSVTDATNRISSLSVENNDRVLELLKSLQRYAGPEANEETGAEDTGAAAQRLSVANALLNHMSWVAALRGHLDSEVTRETVDSIGDPERCSLGRWLQDAGSQIVEDEQASKQLDETHRRLHRQATELLESDEGNREKEELFQKVLDTSREIVEMLTAHQQEDGIRWTPDISVSVPTFDDHHRRLFQTVNKLYKAMRNGAGREVLTEVTDELIEYTGYHFGAEEKVLDAVGSSLCVKQQAEHRQLVNKMQELREDIIAGKPMVAIEVMEFLRNWVTDHIRGCDKLYASELKDVNVAQILEDA